MRGNKKLKFIDRYVGIIFCFLFGNLSKLLSFLKKQKKHPIKKILLIKLAALGDTILLVPAIRSIREKYPHAFMSMVVTYINKDIVENCPYLNEIMEFPVVKYAKNPFKIISFAKKLQQGKFDIVIDFEQWSRISSVLTYFSGSPERIGFKTDKQYRHYVYTKAVEHNKNKHEVENFFDIARSINCSTDNSNLEIWTDENDVEEIKMFLDCHGIKAGEKFVVFHPGCGVAGYPREWNRDKYAELGKKIINEYGIKIILTGDKQEKNKTDYIAGKIGENAINSAGQITGRKLAELFKRSSLVVCGNTGAMHVAAALKVPLVALHGPTDPEKWGPWRHENSFVIRKSMDCSPCLYLGFEYGCNSYDCMKLITIEDVYAKIREIFR